MLPPTRDRKKGVAWTEEEHKMFLLGLQKLGKGDWKGISRNYVTSRTPSQVASHAQKYFNRQTNLNKSRKKKSSVFDIISDTAPYVNLNENQPKTAEPSSQFVVSRSPEFCKEVPSATNLQVLPLPPTRTESNDRSDVEFLHGRMAYLPPHLEDLNGDRPSVFAWERLRFQGSDLYSDSKVVRPTPVLPTTPISIDFWNGISQFSLSASPPTMRPSPLSLKLSKDSSRHSAFHSSKLFRSKEIDSNGGNVISVV